MLASDARVIMISGANRGIGRAVAEVLYGEGYRLSLGTRKVQELNRELAHWDAARVLVHPFDATDPTAPNSWVATTVARFGRLDGLVNNAGIARHAGLEDEDETALDELWTVNVKGPLRLTRAALPHLRRSGSGRIVNVSSLSGKRVKNDNVGYAMSKFALLALTHATRRAGWDDGIRCTALCPSFVATDLTREITKVSREEMIQPADLARLVATVMALPNTATVAELLVNCRLEDML